MISESGNRPDQLSLASLVELIEIFREFIDILRSTIGDLRGMSMYKANYTIL